MARNTAFVPATPPGEISKLIIATHDDDEAFKVMVVQQQTAINLAYEDTAETAAALATRPLRVPSGPSAMLVVLHTGAEAQVVCIHAMRAYQLGSLIPVTTDPSLVGKIFGFYEELYFEDGTTWPICLMQPTEIAALAVDQPTRVPNDDALAAAFASYDAAGNESDIDDLMGGDITSTEVPLPKILVIPTVMFPIFAMPQSPRSALSKIEAMLAAMPDENRTVFTRTIQFLRASCVIRGGNALGRELCRMSTMWSLAPSSSLPFRKWKREAMKSLYTDSFTGAGPPQGENPTAGVASLFGAGAAEAFGASFGIATNAAIGKLGDKWKEVRTEERLDTAEKTKLKSKWSSLAQNRILRCHGHAVDVEWDETTVTEIWGLYQQALREGSSPVAGIVETFALVFHREPSVLEGERPHLAISSATAKCIKEGRLCPAAGLLSYANIDEGLMPLAFVRRDSSAILEDTYQEEEYQRTTIRTMEGEKARSLRTKVKKAPDTYSDTIGLLRGYAEVVKEHFTTECSGFRETNRVFQCLCQRQETWKDRWDGVTGARFWWLFSRSVHEWMAPSEWSSFGAAPTMDVAPLINYISSGSFPIIVDMPIQLVKLGNLPPPGVPHVGGGRDKMLPPTPGQGFQIKNNPNVHPKIKAGLWPALEKFGGRSTLRSLMSYGPAAGSSMKFVSTIISDAHCHEFVVAGRCAERRCQRKHDPSFSPGPEQVDKFLDKVKSIAAYVMTNDSTSLERVRKRMRPHS